MKLYVAALLVVISFAGCLSGDDDQWPEYQGESEVDFGGPLTGFGPTTAYVTNSSGNGIWIHNDVLYWSHQGLETFDVSDPENVVPIGRWAENNSRDVDILEWQGSTYALLAGSGNGIHVLNVDDPREPTLVGTWALPSAGVHNLAAVPGTPYIYSAGASSVRMIDVLDITNPLVPVQHSFPIPAEWNGIPVNSNGCHDITVRVDLGRAYCAGGGSQYMSGGGETFIWDISKDPTNPEWIAMIDDPRLIYHHQAFVNKDGTILIINDEYIQNNCVNYDLPIVPNQAEPKIPFAAAWIYDVSDETNPVQLSFVQSDQGNPDPVADQDPPTNCGSHFGDLILGREAFVMGWYQGGTLLVDFSDPSEPAVIDTAPAIGATWDAQYYKGYVYHSGRDLMVTQLL